jgi:hypothetical protein
MATAVEGRLHRQLAVKLPPTFASYQSARCISVAISIFECQPNGGKITGQDERQRSHGDSRENISVVSLLAYRSSLRYHEDRTPKVVDNVR